MKFILFMIIFSSLALQGCYQGSNDEDCLRTVPTTNNPNNLPHQGSGPGLPL